MGNTPPQKRREASYEVYGTPARGSPGSLVRLRAKRRRGPAAASAAGRPHVDEDARWPGCRLRGKQRRPPAAASDEHDPVVETAIDQLTPVPEENASDVHMVLVESASMQPTDDTSFLHVCRSMAPLGDGDLALRVATRAEHFYNMAGRRDVGAGDVNTLAWLSLAASFLGEDRAFIAKLHGGSPEHRAALQRACVLGVNLIGGSSVYDSWLKKNASPYHGRHQQTHSPSSIPHHPFAFLIFLVLTSLPPLLAPK